jgi:hypothetical protein
MEQRFQHREEAGARGTAEQSSADSQDIDTTEAVAPAQASVAAESLTDELAAMQRRQHRFPDFTRLVCNGYLLYILAMTCYSLYLIVIYPYLSFTVPQSATSIFSMEYGQITVSWWNLALAFGAPALLLAKINRQAGTIKRLKATLGSDRAAFRPAGNAPQQIGKLIDALVFPDRHIRNAASRSLILRLPRLRPEEAALLDDFQRDSLYRRLNRIHAFHHPDLTIAILKAIENIGDAGALLYVERLAEGRAWTGGMRRVQEAARWCLPALEAHIAGREETGPDSVPSPALSSAESSENAETETLTPEMRYAAEQVQSLLQQLEEERRTHRQPAMRVAFLIGSWLIIVPYTATQLYVTAMERNWPVAAIWGLLFAFSTQMHRFVLSPKQSEAALKLARYDDVRAVGPLAEVLEWPNAEMRDVAADALTSLLPRLRASDVSLLNAQQRACLYRKLTPGHARSHLDLQIAILKALQQVGDDAAVRPVERLANMFAVTQRQRYLKQAAEECLLFLRERADLTRASQTLLRASSRVTTSPDLLLRAATDGPETPQEQLLRASRSKTD